MTVHEGRSFAVLVKHSIAPVWCAATFDRSRVSFQRGEAAGRARRDVAPGIRRRTRCGAADGCAGQCKGENLSAGPCGPARGGPNDSSRGEVIRCLGETQYSAGLVRCNIRSVTSVFPAWRGWAQGATGRRPGIRRRTRCGAADGCAGQCKGESLSAGPCGPARGGPNDSSRGEVIRCLGEAQYSADLMRRNMRSVTTVLTARRGGRWHVPAGLRRAATAPRGGLNRRAMRGCSKGKIKCRAIAARRGEVPITGHEGRSFTALEKTV